MALINLSTWVKKLEKRLSVLDQRGSEKIPVETGRKGYRGYILLFIVTILMASGCAGPIEVVERPEPVPPPKTETAPERLGYAIQIGAFSNLENAVRLTDLLDLRGLNAYYFRHPSGLYKVRFGDFPSKVAAIIEADDLVAKGVIDGYYVVSPDDYAIAKNRQYNSLNLRKDILNTAESFLGLPYRWGGSSPDKGFDCSGLTMAVYELNGLRLPRSSWTQYDAGRPIDRDELKKGDLVFFATSRPRRVSHVGLYAGENRFIHAPGKGKKIRFDELSNPYYDVRYMGARRYI